MGRHFKAEVILAYRPLKANKKNIRSSRITHITTEQHEWQRKALTGLASYFDGCANCAELNHQA